MPGVTPARARRRGWCAALALLCLAGQAFAAGPRPNVIIFFVDDLGWADPGAYGSRWHQTPAIDALATRGVRFTHAYAASPVCSPTRAALLTGQNPARLGLTDWLPGSPPDARRPLKPPPIPQQLPLAEQTLAERLRAAGYATAHIGKWHLGGAGFGPRQQGFDVNVGGDHHAAPRSYFFPYADPREPMPGLKHGAPGEYLTDRLTTEAENFIKRNAKRPFLLYFAHYAAHVPLQARPSAVARFRALRRPPGEQHNPVYAAMLASVDESLGRLVAQVTKLRLTGRTVIILTSDNGGLSTQEGPNTPATSNAPLRAGKGYLYEGGIRVPLLIAWPGSNRPGTSEATPVSSVDIMPTVLAMAGVKAPAGGDGTSLVPLLERGGQLAARRLHWHYPHYSVQGGLPGGAIRAGRLKLLENYEDGSVELYDLATDPGETTDLAESEPATAQELRGELAAWRASVNAAMPAPNPDYRPPSIWSRFRNWLKF